MTTGTFEGLRTVSVNGVSLAYREQGSGEPVVFVHGSGTDLRTWERQIPAVGAGCRAVAYSRRYARPNEDIEPGVDDQMLPHVDDLIALLQSLDIPAAHIVGHSWGGFIGLLTAICHPHAVRSLVLMEPPVLPLFLSVPPRPSDFLRLALRRPNAALAIMRFGATAIAPAQKAFLRGNDEKAMRAFGCGVLGKATYERLAEDRKQRLRENLKACRAQLLGAGFPPLGDDEVRGVCVPTLLMVGEQSPPLLRQLSNRLHQLLPHSERLKIPRASHMLHEDNAEMVNAAILGFVERHARQTSSDAPGLSAPCPEAAR